MATSRRTWCRTCGRELHLPRWRAAIGLNAATCADEDECRNRFLLQRSA